MKAFLKEFIKIVSTIIVMFGMIILHFFQLTKEFDLHDINLYGLTWLTSTIIGFYVAAVTFAVIFLIWIWRNKKIKKTEDVEE